MTARLPADAQRRFHRYVASLIAATSLTLAVVELSRAPSVGLSSMLAWAGYLVIFLWALFIIRSRVKGSAMNLVLAQMAFWAALIVIEALYGADVTAFDFTTTFGTVMMLGVLAGTLAAESRLVWALAIASTISLWSVAVGSLMGDSFRVLGVRATISAAGVVFTTALVSKLFDQLAHAIARYDRSRRLHDAIARCSEALLVQTDAFAVYEAVRALLDATDADYGYVDITIDVDGVPGWEIVADASKRPVGYGAAWKVGSYGSIPSIHESLFNHRAVVVHTSELEGEERRLYEADGIRSEVCVPIFVEGVFKGSIGFVQYTSDRRWHDTEIQTLWRASHMIGAYWQRQDQADALRASNESKDRLLASVSHEIRTPLTAIVGLSDEIMSAQRSLGAEELRELNGIIAAQSRELAELVEDLLVASKADFGKLSMRPEPVDLHSQAQAVIQGVRESHPSAKTIELLGDPTEAWADPLRVRQVLRNLLTNALKYGGDRILVTLERAGEAARVVVADDGPGVSPDEAELIFERYYRSVDSPTQPGSVGIGLAVSRQLAEMMGGSLDYRVRSSGHRFELTLPSVRNPAGAGIGSQSATEEAIA